MREPRDTYVKFSIFYYGTNHDSVEFTLSIVSDKRYQKSIHERTKTHD